MTNKDESQRKVPKLRFKGFHDDWEQRKLGNLLAFSNGVNASKKQYGHGTKMISVMDILAEGRMTYESIRNSVLLPPDVEKNSHVNQGDLVFVRSSEIPTEAGWAKFYSSKRPAVFSGFSIRGKRKSPYSPLYLEGFLNHAGRRQMNRLASGSTHFNISQTSLSSISLPYPQIKEQDTIGTFIENLEDTIALHQRKLELLKKLKQGYLQKLFPQNGQSVPQLRFAQFDGDWEQHKLGELARVTTGKAFDSNDFDDRGQYLVITNKNVQDQMNGIISIGDHINASQKVSDLYGLGGENILVTMDGVNIGKVGRYTDSKAVLAQRVGRLTGEHLSFIFQLVDNNQFLIKMNQVAVGNAIKHISLMQISNYTVLVPKADIEKKQIGVFLVHVANTIALHKRKIILLQEIKQGYLQNLFI